MNSRGNELCAFFKSSSSKQKEESEKREKDF
jgi:hypothetical protein